MPKKWLPAGTAIVVTVTVSAFLYAFSVPCLILKNGETGKVIASFPVNDGEEFSVTFVHSVNQTPVTEVYRIKNGRIYLVRAVYYSFGAGVPSELGEGEDLEYGPDGAMILSGLSRSMDRLSYIVGTVSDHILQIGGESISLRELCGRNTRVQFTYGRRLTPFLTRSK